MKVYENPNYLGGYSICPVTGLRVCEVEDLVFVREDGLSRIDKNRSKYKGLWLYRSPDSAGYSRLTTPKLGTVKTHRIIYKAFISDILLNPKDGSLVIDHINGNKADNRIDNLREISRGQNRTNTKQGRDGKLPGLTWHKVNKVWISSIRINKHLYCLGSFKDEITANEKYNEAVINWESFGKLPIKLSKTKEVKGYSTSKNSKGEDKFICKFKHKGINYSATFKTSTEAHNYFLKVKGT